MGIRRPFNRLFRGSRMQPGKKMGGQRKCASLCSFAFRRQRSMLPDRRLLIAALVCSAGLLWTGLPTRAQAPAPPAKTLDRDHQAKLDADQLVADGKYLEAAAAYENILKNFPGSPFGPEAMLRAGAAYVSAGKFEQGLAIYQNVVADKKSTPEIVQIAGGLVPQALVAKAVQLKEPERSKVLNEALKAFDLHLAKYPTGEEMEATLYAKGMALFQVARYADAGGVLLSIMRSFPNSPTVADSQYLLALINATVAAETAKKPGGEKTSAAQFAEAERLLREILSRRPNLALANDTQFQIGELLFSRASGTADPARRTAGFSRAIEAYRSVIPKDQLLAQQQQWVASLTAGVGLPQQDPAVLKARKRQLDREQGKLAEIKQRPDQAVMAKIRSGQIFSLLGKHDESRVLLSHLEQAGSLTEPDQQKLVQYYIARSYAAQKLAAKAEEKYQAFQTAHKADPIAQDLPLLLAGIFLSEDPKLKDPVKAEEYLKQAKEMYPGGAMGDAATLMQAQVWMQEKKYDDALKVLNEALAKSPSVDAEFFRATLYAQTGKTAEAIAGYKKVRTTYPGLPQAEQAHFQVAQLLGAKEPKAAISEFQSFVAKFPESTLLPAALFEVGKMQKASGQKDAALATFKSLATQYPKSAPAPFTYFERAKILNDNQQLDECAAVLRELVANYQDNAPLAYQAYDFIGQIHTSRKKNEEAIAAYEEFAGKFSQAPQAAEALLKQSTLWKAAAEGIGTYVTLGESQRAEWRAHLDKSAAAAERVLEKYPESPFVALALKNLLAIQRLEQSLKLKTPTAVEKFFTDLATKYGGKPATKTKIAFTHAAFTFEQDKAKAFAQMSATYDKAQKFAPDDLDLYGLALIDAKKFDEAIAVYEKLALDYPLPASGKAPRDIQEAQAISLFGLGKALQEKGDKEGGAKKFAELETLYPWSTKMLEVQYGIALDLHDKKEDDKAETRLRDVIKSPLANAELRAKSMLLLGRIFEDTKRYAEAIDNYVKISVFYEGIDRIAAEGLWRGAQLLERQASGEIPMPTPVPKPTAPPKPAGTPPPKPDAVPPKK